MNINQVNLMVAKFAGAKELAWSRHMLSSRWQIYTKPVVTVVRYQTQMWGGLVTSSLIVNLRIKGDQSLDYHQTWLNYPDWDCVSYESFGYTVDSLIKRYIDDLEMQKVIYPNHFAHTGS